MIPTFPPNFESRKLVYALDMPSFQRDFATYKTLNHGTGPDITFTRSSGGTYFDANGVLQTAANNIPRFDHDPATGDSLGLLMEGSRTNLHLYSQDFSQGWVNTGASTLAVDATETGLDGTLSVGGFTCSDTSAVTRRLYASANIATASGTDYTFSVYLKSINSWPIALVHCSSGTAATSTSGNARFDLINGTVVGSVTGTAQIQSVGNGWYRCSVTTTGNTITTMRPKIILIDSSDDGAAASVTGVTGAGVYVWGAQLEAGQSATSYIPTTTASATRSAETAVVTPVLSFYNQTEGTLFVDVLENGVAFNIVFADFSDGTASNRIGPRRPNISTLRFRITENGVDGADISTALNIAPQNVRMAGAYQTDNAAFSVNGNTVATDTSVVIPATMTRLGLGAAIGSTARINGHIRKVAYWPKRLSDALLEEISS